MPAPSKSTISSSWDSWETFSPWLASSAMIGPAIDTDSSAGITVMNGANSDRKMISSRMMMKRKAAPCTWLPVLPDCFCWSALMANWPVRCTCIPAGGDDAAIAARMLSMRPFTAVSLPVDTSDCTWIWAACPSTPCGPGTCDWPTSRAFTTVGTLARSLTRVPRYAWSAALNDPVLTAATTGTGTVDVENPSGAARFAAWLLGASAGRNALLLPCVTLESEGSAFGMAIAATIQRSQHYPAELDGELTNRPENVIDVHSHHNSGPPEAVPRRSQPVLSNVKRSFLATRGYRDGKWRKMSA